MTRATSLSRECPDLPGTYVLGLYLEADRQLVVGRFGTLDFPVGVYAYVGSARGAGGLRARLERHWRGPRRLHWHVDYLRRAAAPVWAIWQLVPGLECTWSQALATFPGVCVPAPGFGATDCRAGCPAHLFLLPTSVDPSAVVAWLAEAQT